MPALREFDVDQYFRDNIYQTRATTGKPCPMSVHGGASPSEPLVHAHGHVGVSSRWWYLSAMYKPVAVCGACTSPPEEQSPRLLRVRYGSKAAPRRVPQTQVASYVRPPLQRTGQLYRVPRMRPSSELSSEGREPWARECVTWPRYRDSEFVLGDGLGESMLELTTEEQRALQVVSLRCEVRKETYGRADHFNWKKVGHRPQRLHAAQVSSHGHRDGDDTLKSPVFSSANKKPGELGTRGPRWGAAAPREPLGELRVAAEHCGTQQRDLRTIDCIENAAQARQGSRINRRQRRCHDIWVPGTIRDPHDLAEELRPGPEAQRSRYLGNQHGYDI